MKAGEMMLASAAVIDHRTRRMSTAGSMPSARDRREFGVMRDEKIKAANQAAYAMTAQFLRLGPADLGAGISANGGGNDGDDVARRKSHAQSAH